MVTVVEPCPKLFYTRDSLEPKVDSRNEDEPLK